MAQQLAADAAERGRLRSILDLGCGTGVLGLALAKHYAAELTARDRDALALTVTAHNAAGNGVTCTTRGGLDTGNLDGTREPGPFQLVVTNLPAKAGAPVLAHMMAAAARVTAARRAHRPGGGEQPGSSDPPATRRGGRVDPRARGQPAHRVPRSPTHSPALRARTDDRRAGRAETAEPVRAACRRTGASTRK